MADNVMEYVEEGTGDDGEEDVEAIPSGVFYTAEYNGSFGISG